MVISLQMTEQEFGARIDYINSFIPKKRLILKDAITVITGISVFVTIISMIASAWMVAAVSACVLAGAIISLCISSCTVRGDLGVLITTPIERLNYIDSSLGVRYELFSWIETSTDSEGNTTTTKKYTFKIHYTPSRLLPPQEVAIENPLVAPAPSVHYATLK